MPSPARTAWRDASSTTPFARAAPADAAGKVLAARQ
jgi:hypothetical protein